MNKKLEMAEHKFIESIGKLCDCFGLNKIVAQLYAVLYLNDRPVSLDEMVEKLKVSKGNVSVNIRELERWNAVKSVWVKGSRKNYYEAELDLKKVISNKLQTGIKKRLSEVSTMLEEFNEIIQSAKVELTEEEKNIVKLYNERLEKINELREFTVNALNFAEDFF